MNCLQVQELAAALIDNETLSVQESREVEQHLAFCASCRYEFEMDSLTSSLVRARIPLVEAPYEAYESIRLAIEND